MDKFEKATREIVKNAMYSDKGDLFWAFKEYIGLSDVCPEAAKTLIKLNEKMCHRQECISDKTTGSSFCKKHTKEMNKPHPHTHTGKKPSLSDYNSSDR